MARLPLVSLVILIFVSSASAQNKTCEFSRSAKFRMAENGCAEAAYELETTETYELERLYQQFVVESLASGVRQSGRSSFDSFTIQRPPLEIIALCCDCVPNGGSCTRVDCAPPDSKGNCPTNKLRVLCSLTDEGPYCTSID